MEIKIDEIVKQVLAEIETAAGQETAFTLKEPSYTEQKRGKGAVLTQPETYEIKDFEIPHLNEKDILVRMEGCMISRIDAAEFLKEKRAGASAAIGQEGTGVIVKLGSDSLKDARGNLLRVGDKVIAMKKAGISGSYFGTAKQEPKGNGWFSDYVVLQAGAMVYQVNELDLESRLLAETVAAVNHAVKRTIKLAKLKESSTAVVLGATMAGFAAIVVLRCNGIKNIIVVGEEEQRNLAFAFGAKEFISSHNSKNMNEARALLEKCAGSLADAVFTCTASSIGKSLAQRLVKASGNICELSYAFGNGREASRYYEESLPVSGRFYTPKEYEEVIELLKKAAKEEIPMYRLITHRYKLEEINEAHWNFIREEGLGIAVFNR